MRRQFNSHVLAAAVVFLVARNVVAANDFAELLTKLPPAANAIVMLDAEQIFASEVATREGWKQKYDATYSDAPLLLPPGARHFVLAAELNLGTMKPNWEAAAMRLKDDPSTNLIARTIGGTPDTIGNLEAVATPRGALIVKFGPQMFGALQPGNRQVAARWVRSAASGGAALSPYLQSAAVVPDQFGTEIIMAIDLTDALSRDRVRQAIEKSDVLRGKKIDLDAAANVLTGVQGATLGVRVSRRAYGKLKVDFNRDVAPLADVAKPLLLEILDEAGAAIDEFADWKVEVGLRQIAIEGELTASGLRRLFSFLSLDATAVAAPAEASPAAVPSGSQAGADAAKSLEYFQAITRHLQDLKNERGAKTYGSIALWFDTYARRIDRLPILGVDKDLVDYGQYVVLRLRDAVDAIRGVGIRSGAQTAGISSGSGDYYLFDSAQSYARREMNEAESQRRAIRANERAQGTTDARSLMREIDDRTSVVRRQMTERYNIEFGAPVKK